jgi:hypothetical protein
MRATSFVLASTLAGLAALAGCKTQIECPSGETNCGGRCVSLLSDANNCGSCGKAATSLQVCRAGALTCAPGTGLCDGTCTDLARDPLHCGSCTSACASSDYCTTESSTTSCTSSCPTGYSACSGACVDLQSDRLNCNACGNACPSGQTCHTGTCGADLSVACYASGDVQPVDAELNPAGASRLAQGSPTVLAAQGTLLYSGNGYPGSVTVFPLDEELPTHLTTLTGNDIEGLTPYAGILLVANAAVNAVAILDADGSVLDELALPGTVPNPHGIAVAGTTAYVSLYGDGPNGFSGNPEVTGQAIALLDLTDLPACVAGTSAHCGVVSSSTIDLTQVAGAATSPGYPFPSKLAVRGTKVYVTLANLQLANCGTTSSPAYGYCEPAGNGKLAIVDTAAGNAVSVVDLGASCQNPGAIAISGNTAWIACGSFTFKTTAPGAIVPVDLSGSTPVVGTAVDVSAIVPGGLAVCSGKGYVTDQASGMVIRFDTTTGLVDISDQTICPTVYFAWAADVACPAE